MFNGFVDLVSKKKWSEGELEAMLGPNLGAYLTYATNAEMRSLAASGGTTTALLIDAMESGIIDGAIVCCTKIEDGKVRARFVLARTKQGILAARGSKYVATNFLKEVLPILKQNEGRFAVCGLPCDITNLTRWERKNPELANKVALKLVFFCGHNSRKELVDGVAKQLQESTKGGTLVDYKFRTGHWRGELTAEFDNGITIVKPFSYFSDYRNLFFYAERKCIACTDHFGYDSDISLGDVWLYSLRDSMIKHTGVVLRTKRSSEIFEMAIKNKAISVNKVSQKMILDGQSRIAPSHYNVSARSLAGKLLGYKIPVRKMANVSPIAWLAAFIGLANMKLSESKRSYVIFKIPRPILKVYMAFKKILETF